MNATPLRAGVQVRPVTFAYTRPLLAASGAHLTRMLTTPTWADRVLAALRRTLGMGRMLFTKPRPTPLDLRRYRERSESWRKHLAS